MNTDFNQLKDIWEESKKGQVHPSSDVEDLIQLAQNKMRSTVRLQWATIIILAITLVLISAFFRYEVHFKHTISHIGIGLMLGGLIIRIFLELISIFLSGKINLTETALKSNHSKMSYFKFRKIMNGPVTVLIVILYSIGFYLLTPEFSLYFSTAMMVLIDLSYILAAVIFIWSIRNAVKKEMSILNEVIRIQEDIIGEYEQG